MKSATRKPAVLALLSSALLAGVALLVAGCAMTSTRQETAQALDNILADPHRTEADRARDRYRHPKDTLLFFGIRPEMSVLEVWPEPGWYTDVIAPLVREHGKYYAAVIEPDPSSRFITARLEAFHNKLASNPTLYGNPTVVTFPTHLAGGGASGSTADAGPMVPAGTVDMVVTFRNIHNWMAEGSAPQAFATIYKALKPGGVLGVVEHRGNPAVRQDPQAKSGYVNEDYAIQLIQAQGFRLVGTSEVSANPKDTKDYEQGVWTLPPTYRLGDKDRDKYMEIGESDRFTLKFEKPRN
jgi:predicted methyltransferase